MKYYKIIHFILILLILSCDYENPFDSENEISAMSGDLTCEVLSDHEVALDWSGHSTATKFVLKKKIKGQDEYLWEEELESDDSFFNDSGLSVGVEYEYSVYATAGDNQTPSIKKTCQTEFTAPENLNVDNDNDVLVVTWDHDCDYHIGYNLEFSNDNQEFEKISEITDPTQTSFEYSELIDMAPESFYYFRISAFSEYNESEFAAVNWSGISCINSISDIDIEDFQSVVIPVTLNPTHYDNTSGLSLLVSAYDVVGGQEDISLSINSDNEITINPSGASYGNKKITVTANTEDKIIDRETFLVKVLPSIESQFINEGESIDISIPIPETFSNPIIDIDDNDCPISTSQPNINSLQIYVASIGADDTCIIDLDIREQYIGNSDFSISFDLDIFNTIDAGAPVIGVPIEDQEFNESDNNEVVWSYNLFENQNFIDEAYPNGNTTCSSLSDEETCNSNTLCGGWNPSSWICDLGDLGPYSTEEACELECVGGDPQEQGICSLDSNSDTCEGGSFHELDGYSVVSDNPDLVLAIIDGDQLQLTLQSNQNGNALVNVYAKTIIESDTLTSEALTFSVLVNAMNDSPFIVDGVTLSNIETSEIASEIENNIQDISLDGLFDDVDILTNGDQLTYHTESSNTNLVTVSTDGDLLSLNLLPNQNGEALISVNASDMENAESESLTFTVIVGGENNSPYIVEGAILNDISTNEDLNPDNISLVGLFDDIDIDTNNDELTYHATSTNNNLVSASTDGASLLLNLEQYQNGEAIISVYAEDNSGATSNAISFLLMVYPINNSPQLSLDSNFIDTNEDEELTISVTASDVDVATNGQNLVFNAISLNEDLVSVSVIPISNIQADIHLSPVLNQYGESNISITVSDLEGGFSNEVLVLNINAVNDVPYIIAGSSLDNVETDEDIAPLAINLSGLFNDVDVNEDLMYYSSSSDQSLATTNTIGSQLFLYPIANQNGSTTISVYAQDDEGDSSESLDFSLTINPVNDNPYIIEGEMLSDINTDEDVNPEAIPLDGLFDDIDIDTNGDVLTYHAISTNDELVSLSINDNTLLLDLIQNQNGEATISVYGQDNIGAVSDYIEFSLMVNPIDDDPMIFNIENQVTFEDQDLQIELSVDDPDLTNLSEVTYTVTGNDNPGLVNLQITDNGLLNLFVINNMNGEANITIQANNNMSGREIANAEFTLEVLPVNDTPYIVNGAAIGDIQANEDELLESVNLFPLFADIDLVFGDHANYIEDLTYNVMITGDDIVDAEIVESTLNISSIQDQNGEAILYVTAQDASYAQSDPIIFSISMSEVNDFPVIAISDHEMIEDANIDDPGATVITISATDVDIATNSQNLDFTASSNDISLVDVICLDDNDVENNTATLTFIPVLDQNGTALITVTVTDGIESVSTDFEIEISEQNDNPFVSGAISNLELIEDGLPETISLVGVFDDVDINTNDDMLIYDVSVDPNFLSVVTASVVGDDLLLTLLPDQNGEDIAINVWAEDSDGAFSPSASFYITINPVNDNPEIIFIDQQETLEDESLTIIVSAIDVDIDTNSQSLTFSASSSNEELVLVDISDDGINENDSATLILNPLSYQNGFSNITITVTDGIASDEVEFVLHVTPVNNAPYIVNEGTIDDVEVDEDGVIDIISLTGLFDDVDIETNSDVLTYTTEFDDELLNVEIIDGDQLSITLLPDQNGNSFIYIQAVDSEGDASEAIPLEIVVTPVNDAPEIVFIDDAVMDEDDPVNITITATDVDILTDSQSLIFEGSIFSSEPENLLIGIETVPFSPSSAGLIFTFEENLSGTATIAVSVTDQNGGIAAQNFTLTVEPVNDAPEISGSLDDIQTDEDVNPPTINLSNLVVFDVENDEYQLEVSTDNPGLVDAFVNGEELSLILEDYQNGSAIISVRAIETGLGGLLSENSVNFTLTVDPINNNPFINNYIPSQEINEDSSPINIDLNNDNAFFGDEDISTNGDELIYNAVIVPGSECFDVEIISNETLRITPILHQFGNGMVMVSAEDTEGLVISQFFEVTVISVNDAPTISGSLVDYENVLQNSDPILVDLSTLTVFDVEDGVDITFSAISNNPGLVILSIINDELTITLQTDGTGEAIISVSAVDSEGEESANSVDFMINVVEETTDD